MRNLLRLNQPASTAQRQADEQAERAMRMIATFEQHSDGWFWETDPQGRLTYITGKVGTILEDGGGAPIGRPIGDLFELDADHRVAGRTLAFHISMRSAFTNYAVRCRNKGFEHWWSITGHPRHDRAGRFLGFIGSGSDLTEKRRSDAAMTQLAFSDTLTGLANRQRMQTALAQALATRHSGFEPVALLLLDLDRFKNVNDTLGHYTGDELLKQVANRLRHIVNQRGLVGRIGGDEFNVLITGGQGRAEVEQLASAIIEYVSQPYHIDGAPITIGCSIGAAFSPDHGTEAEALTRNADLALYTAKDCGRGRYRVFTSEMLVGARTRKQLEDDLRQALTAGQLHLVYQPIVAVQSERISGYEALLRWNHPSLGPISPADFIPVAEECGLIERIGEWVMRTAAAEAAGWPNQARVAVNVSPRQFANPNLPDLVANVIAQSGLRPDRLELEITEGVFMGDGDHAEQVFRLLKRIGVRLALDDFGTGYSALGYLKSAPFDKIKIDQSFVRGAIDPKTRNAAIIRAIVTLAEALGMETTAEGVEQHDEISLIETLGCSHIQGFVYGRAVPSPEVRRQLERQDGQAERIGYKISRMPRNKVILGARLLIGERAYNVSIRNISDGGIMVEGADLTDAHVGLVVQVQIPDKGMVPTIIRWVKDKRAGLQTSGVNLQALCL